MRINSDTDTPTILVSNWLGWSLGYSRRQCLSAGETTSLLVGPRVLTLLPSGTQQLTGPSYPIQDKAQMLSVCSSRPRSRLMGHLVTTFPISLVGLLLILLSLGHYHGTGTVSGP